ncbi:unnamed protein product [Brassica rapa subsp. trilocularis]
MEDFFTRVSNDLSFASKIGGVLIESGSSFQQKLKEPLETADHLFFKCLYSAHIWEALMKGVMESQFIMEWETITSLLMEGSNWSKVKLFVS